MVPFFPVFLNILYTLFLPINQRVVFFTVPTFRPTVVLTTQRGGLRSSPGGGTAYYSVSFFPFFWVVVLVVCRCKHTTTNF